MIDGVLVAEADKCDVPLRCGEELRTGCSYDGTMQCNGLIEDLLTYPRSLSAREARDLFVNRKLVRLALSRLVRAGTTP